MYYSQLWPFGMKDTLAIYDGDSNSSTNLATITGHMEHLEATAFRSAGRKMYVQFQTDGVLSSRGFMANYTFDEGSVAKDCSESVPCNVTEGHCQSDAECSDGLMCDSCDAGLGYPADTHCCNEIPCSYWLNVTTNGTGGSLTSPYYPNNYGDNVDCSWTIAAPYDHSITMTFVSFHVSFQNVF